MDVFKTSTSGLKPLNLPLAFLALTNNSVNNEVYVILHAEPNLCQVDHSMQVQNIHIMCWCVHLGRIAKQFPKELQSINVAASRTRSVMSLLIGNRKQVAIFTAVPSVLSCDVTYPLWYIDHNIDPDLGCLSDSLRLWAKDEIEMYEKGSRGCCVTVAFCACSHL